MRVLLGIFLLVGACVDGHANDYYSMTHGNYIDRLQQNVGQTTQQWYQPTQRTASNYYQQRGGSYMNQMQLRTQQVQQRYYVPSTVRSNVAQQPNVPVQHQQYQQWKQQVLGR